MPAQNTVKMARVNFVADTTEFKVYHLNYFVSLYEKLVYLFTSISFIQTNIYI